MKDEEGADQLDENIVQLKLKLWTICLTIYSLKYFLKKYDNTNCL